MSKRSCGTCTKCCEGNLVGEALGYKFYAGKPCHFVSIGKGCAVYAQRPANPCASYKCAWLYNLDIPEWIKPNEANVIIDSRNVKDIEYISLREAGAKLDSAVLTWAITYATSNQRNLCWQVNGGYNYIGTPEFVEAMNQELLA